MNQFSDLNPYEPPPIRAELVEKPYQPPRVAVKKIWPPVFSILWLAAGPFVTIAVLRYCVHTLQVVSPTDHALVWCFLLAGAGLWLVALARLIVWFFRGLVG